MGLGRRPFQGIANVVRFNWHFYIFAVIGLTAYLTINCYLPQKVQIMSLVVALVAILSMVLSLISTYYIYDISDLYELNWLDNMDNKKVLNINAGFDETSEIITHKYPLCQLTPCDFYDPTKHTEVSIKRARKAYPPQANTVCTDTDKLPFESNSFDCSVAILSAHEIRNKSERIAFFTELKRVTKPTGTIYVTEHLRDYPNFLVYTIGALHFYSRPTWLSTFKEAELLLKQEIKTTPFITNFILQPDGNTS